MSSPLPHALIVEDDPAERAGLSSFVASEGFETSQAASLAEARRILRSRTPDLILCDFQLPDGRGTQLLEDPGRRFDDSRFVLVTSALWSPEVRRREHLPKPVDLREIERVLARARGAWRAPALAG